VLNDVIDNDVTENDVIDSRMNMHTLLASRPNVVRRRARCDGALPRCPGRLSITLRGTVKCDSVLGLSNIVVAVYYIEC